VDQLKRNGWETLGCRGEQWKGEDQRETHDETHGFSREIWGSPANDPLKIENESTLADESGNLPIIC